MFTVCDTVVTDREDNVVSLHSIIENVTAPAPSGSSVPDKARAPLRWSTFSLWLKAPEDDGRRFEQRVELFTPDGQRVVQADVPFQAGTRTNRVTVRGFGFPISQAGEHIFRLSLREVNDDSNWHQVAEYPVRVSHQTDRQQKDDGPEPAAPPEE